MSDVYVVLMQRGAGEIAGVFTNYPEAVAYIGARPLCNYQITQETVDANVGGNVSTQLLYGPVEKKGKKGDKMGNKQ